MYTQNSEGMDCYLYSCLFLAMTVLFQKAGFTKSTRTGAVRLRYALQPSENLKKQPSSTQLQNNFHVKPGETSNDLTILHPLYQLKKGKNPCILLTVDAILNLKYLTTLHKEQVRDIYVPFTPKISGNCSDQIEQNLAISWRTFVLKWNFLKLPEKGWWFVSKIELQCDPSDLFYEFINAEGISYTLSSDTNIEPSIAAPIGKSFICDREIKVDLSSTQINMIASLYMRAMVVKPFLDNKDFEESYFCSSIGLADEHRGNPLTIGCLLAVSIISSCTT
ncbi:unnamed protein product [Nezara viridula]|uniref:Lysosome-associated membrane glycoprotein 2-like luminal domain-containing protein n=1 Tax=Nezara viridula TaxID=85310 RepID=A0A9P0MKD0_NEZVI|nr:unnamed protein product [Nezara viridula]